MQERSEEGEKPEKRSSVRGTQKKQMKRERKSKSMKRLNLRKNKLEHSRILGKLNRLYLAIEPHRTMCTCEKK